MSQRPKPPPLKGRGVLGRSVGREGAALLEGGAPAWTVDQATLGAGALENRDPSQSTGDCSVAGIGIWPGIVATGSIAR